MAALPSKTVYIEGNTLDVTGGRVKILYNNGTSETVDLTAAMASPTTLSTVGDAVTVTVTHLGKTTSFTVKVNAKAVSSIAMEAQPTKTSYIEGNTLDVAGGSIRVQYDNGTSAVVPLTAEMVSPTALNTVGETTVTVTYSGKTTTFTVTVAAKSVVSVALKTPPTQTMALPGETLAPAGGSLTVTYDNGTTETVALTAAMLAYDEDTLGDQEVTVTFGGKTATFSILVATAAMQGMVSDCEDLDAASLTLADEAAVAAMETRLNALSEEERQALPNLSELKAAIARIAELKAGTTTAPTETTGTTGTSGTTGTTGTTGSATDPEGGAATGMGSPLPVCLLLGGLSAGAALGVKVLTRKKARGK